jgi:NAD(P)-dependent dehydrogenase (short-subunit alcohol dehydrogenase family)
MVVFGGSSGIGLATAILAAKQGANQITIVGRNEERLTSAVKKIKSAATSQTCTVSSASVDVTDEAKVQQFASTFEDGSVDHLVTTPGGSARLGNLIANNRSCDDVRRQFNLKYFAQLAPVLAMSEKIKDHGSITMVSGILSRRTGRGNDALAVSNAAIETTVRCLANDFGFDGRQVRVNCLSPGMTLTPVYGDSDWVKDYQHRSAAAVPLQRNGKPEEMAHAIAFLQTNLFVTGITIDVDGGNVIKP